MKLGEFNKVLATNRIDKNIPMRTFCGEMNAIASNTEATIPADCDEKNKYFKIFCHRVFSTDFKANGVAVSGVQVRAALKYKIKKFSNIVDYIINNISLDGLKNVINKIYDIDSAYVKKNISTIISLCADIDDERVLSKIYATFITEYYYYELLFSIVEHELPYDWPAICIPFLEDNDELSKSIINYVLSSMICNFEFEDDGKVYKIKFDYASREFYQKNFLEKFSIDKYIFIIFEGSISIFNKEDADANNLIKFPCSIIKIPELQNYVLYRINNEALIILCERHTIAFKLKNITNGDFDYSVTEINI